MKPRGPFRNDLVIGMTLAEVFLLLLIVGWYGSRLESEETGREPLTPAEVLEQELKEANHALEQAKQEQQRLENKLHEFERILDWLGEHLGAPRPIRDIPSVNVALRDYTFGVKRGKPLCEAQNTLVHVEADDDRLTVTLHQPFKVENVSFDANQALTERQEIERFLGSVEKYYSQRRAFGRDCAFDFTLAWRTDHDYRVAKKKFEPYFYPAGDRQLQ